MATRLLVQLSIPTFSGKTPVDRSQDPEMRWGLPMTYGICRTNRRQITHVGDEIAFVMRVPEDGQYYLAAWFVVAETLRQDFAAAHFAGRPNVILETPSSPDDDTMLLGGVQWARSKHDRANSDHDDWKHRALAPYLISDTVHSRIIRPAVLWDQLVMASGKLLPEIRRNRANKHNDYRLDTNWPEGAVWLRAYVAGLEHDAEISC